MNRSKGRQHFIPAEQPSCWYQHEAFPISPEKDRNVNRPEPVMLWIALTLQKIHPKAYFLESGKRYTLGDGWQSFAGGDFNDYSA
ncbi:MAG: hypothetical protein KME64_34280 [Scytonematopsis contorta HA4267-MV1]|nr:hypothetical protein [Scytonematopsis contorta HA4267-MV1]